MFLLSLFKRFTLWSSSASCYVCKKFITIEDKYTLLCNNCYGEIISVSPITLEYNHHKVPVHALGLYDSLLKQLLMGKYCFDVSPYIFLGHRLQEYIKRNKIEFDIIITIPQYPFKQALRWFNHAYEIGHVISVKSRVRIFPHITCIKMTNQSYKNAKDRLLMQKNTFLITHKEELHKKKILLIDDVFTTGTTMKIILDQLNDVNYESCTILVAART